MAGDPALLAKLMCYLKWKQDSQQVASFVFGEYGRNLNYTSQPNLAGIIENQQFLEMCIAELKPIYRKSTTVRCTFQEVNKQYKAAKVNVSSYPDATWARWCACAAILLIEHVHKLASQTRVYRQVLLQDTGGMKLTLDKLINLYCGGSPIKAEHAAASDHVLANQASSSNSVRRDYSQFVGGSVLRACLNWTGSTTMPPLDDDQQEEEQEEAREDEEDQEEEAEQHQVHGESSAAARLLLEEALRAPVAGTVLKEPAGAMKRPAAAAFPKPGAKKKKASGKTREFHDRSRPLDCDQHHRRSGLYQLQPGSGSSAVVRSHQS